MMDRTEISQICEIEVLETAARLFGTSKDRLGKFEDFEGCANLVYFYECNGQQRILRISYNPDRPVELIQAELHFVNYLTEVGCAFETGALRERKSCRSDPRCRDTLHRRFVCQGARYVHADNGYRYREGVPMQEYFRNWGRCLARCTGWQKPTSR